MDDRSGELAAAEILILPSRLSLSFYATIR
jgi:hypothetical protein